MRGMIVMKTLIRGLILCVLLLPSLAQATTDWDDGFEYANQAAVEATSDRFPEG